MEPCPTPSTSGLAALLDRERMQTLLEGFADTVGIGTAIIDLQGGVFVGARWQKACTGFHRVNPLTAARCLESDTALADQMQTGQGHAIYKCRNGLVDAAAPLRIGGRHVANVFVGQFLTAPPDLAFFARQAAEAGFEPEAYLAAVRALPIIAEARLPGILRFLTELTGIIATVADERLRASRDQFRAVIEAAPDALVIAGPDGRIRLVNAQAERLFGWTRDELANQPVELLLPERLRHGHHPRRTEYQARPEVRAMGQGRELSARRKDGSEFPVEISLSPFIAEDGARVVCSAVRDISERRRLEREVAARGEQLRRILDSSSEGVFEVDAQGQVTFANPACCRMLGYGLGQLLGRPVHALVHHHHADGSDYLLERCPMWAAYTRGETHHVEDEVLWRADGTALPVSYGATPIRQDGAIIGAVVTFTDVTARRQAEQALKHAHFLADSALDLTRAGYWHVPLDGSGWFISSERAAAIFGDQPRPPDWRYRVMEEWGANVVAGDPEAAKPTFANFQAAIDGTVPRYDATYAYKRPCDGRVVWIHALGTVVRDASGKATDMYGVTQDITAFKQLEFDLLAAKTAAEAATRAKSDFLANMSHEIRTPMNAIIGMSHLALKTELTPKQRDYVAKIDRAAKSLLEIINEILDFSKIEAGRLEIERAPFALETVLDQLAALISQRAHEKGLEFVLNADPALPPNLVGDALRLGQVLLNLCGNAVKFTESGEVVVTVTGETLPDRRLRLAFRVRDTGIGMSSEQLGRLFQSFSQADSSTTRKYGGTGLGLTISKRLVELMGGSVTVESAPGVGSTFGFTIEVGVGETPGASASASGLTGLRCLVVDDNASARQVMTGLLESLRLRADAVASGPAAIQAAVAAVQAGDPYRLVCMDWKMPGMDGLAASRAILAAVVPPPRIILATAYGSEGLADEARQAGIAGFLVKPVNPSTLLDTAMQAMGHSASGVRRAAAAADPAGLHPRVRGARVLLAEDNEINQQVASELLEQAGVVVTIANNGQEALARMPEGFDLVLMDIQMPVLDGYSAARAILADPRFAGVPILAMTANAMEADKERAAAAGMRAHIAKPIDPPLLYAALDRWLPAGLGVSAPDPCVPAAADPALPAELPGVDQAAGLRRVGGNRALYRRLLGQFATSEADAVARIRAALAAGDPATALRRAHTLKGVAANLGIVGVQAAAAALEAALKSGAGQAELAALPGTLDPVLAGLRPLLPAAAAQAVADPAAALAGQRAGLQRLRALLEGDDTAATDLAESLAAATGHPALAEVQRLAGDFDFPGALARLDALLIADP